MKSWLIGLMALSLVSCSAVYQTDPRSMGETGMIRLSELRLPASPTRNRLKPVCESMLFPMTERFCLSDRPKIRSFVEIWLTKYVAFSLSMKCMTDSYSPTTGSW